MRKLGRKGCAYIGSVEERQRQVRLEWALEYGEDAPAVWPLLDWSKEGSPRELFLLDVVAELRSELAASRSKLAVEEKCNASTKKILSERIDRVLDQNNTEEWVMRIEEQELELQRDLAKYPRPVWVCACERVLDDECALCQDGVHTV